MTSISDQTRRQFLHTAAVGAAASVACLRTNVATAAAPAADTNPTPKKRPLKLAMASYTLRKFDLDQALAMTKRVGLDAINLKSFHLPMDATKPEIEAAAKKIKDAGILFYGGGVISMKDEKQVNQAFEYAKTAGMLRIIGVPAPEMLSLVNDKVQQYDIQVCIHNHGPGDKIWPTPDVAYARIKNLDKRIGLCHDIGHTARSGMDPAAMTRQCADRIYDVHIKDVTAPTKAGHATPCGRGIIDIPAVLRALIDIRYQNYLAFEYESEADDPLPGVAESIGYVNGVMDAL